MIATSCLVLACLFVCVEFSRVGIAEHRLRRIERKFCEARQSRIFLAYRASDDEAACDEHSRCTH